MNLAWEEIGQCTGHEAGRQLLERMYFAETGEKLPEIQYTAQGKPYFPGKKFHFSISHTAKHVFCALSDRNIGIDAEEMDRVVSESVAQRFLSEAEQRRLSAFPDLNQGLLRLWVLKESWAKLTGRGLGNYLKDTDFDPADPRVWEMGGCYVAVLQEEEYGPF